MSRISNYEELVVERRRVELIIAEKKQLLHEKIQDLKEKITPLLYILPILNVFKKRDSNSPLLKAGASMAIDLLVGQRLLSKAGWLARLIVPTLLKTVSSRVIENVKKED